MVAMANIRFNPYTHTAGVTRKSFYQFFLEFWDIMVPGEDLEDNWHIPYLCNELQECAELVFDNQPREHDLIINVPPGTTKSTIFSVAFAPWTWTRMPRARHICGSHTDNLVLDLSNRCRDVVKSERYQKMFPEIQLRDDQDAKHYWMNNYGGFRFSCTVAGRTPTGFHGHFLTVDDPIDPKKAISQLEIKAAQEWMARVLPSRKVNKRVSLTTLIMQRLAVEDPTGTRLKNLNAGPVKHICLPCDITWPIKPKRLEKFYYKRKGLLDPKRLPRSVMREQRAELGELGYSGQYGQQPTPPGGAMFKVKQLTIGQAPYWMKKTVRYWDKAYTQDGGAYTVGVKMGIDKEGKIWVIDVVRGQWESYEREKRIKQTAYIDGYQTLIRVEQEPAAGKESVQNTIRNLAGFRVSADKRGGDNDGNKIRRADPFADQVNGGNVWLHKAAWNDDYIEELQFFPMSKFKDQVDASSGAFNTLFGKQDRIGAAFRESKQEIRIPANAIRKPAIANKVS